MAKEIDRYESPERDVSQGYASEESLSDRYELQLEVVAESEEAANKVFANRNLNLNHITAIGFDMDYTLAEYISPHFDILAFDLAKNHLVEKLNFPSEILNLPYNPRFPVRGLWYDKELGNLLKVDQFGIILRCVHGFRELSEEEVEQLYPQSVQKKDSSRIFVMNTLFNLPETHLIASLIDYYDRKCLNETNCSRSADGWDIDGQQLTFKALFQDLRAAIDHIHLVSMELKKRTVADLQRYVKKDERLSEVLRSIRAAGKKPFLVTNSEWWYTDRIMSFLLDAEGQERWLDYFDLVIVDACKPGFFSSGKPVKRVDIATGELTEVSKPDLSESLVYDGGCHETITELLGVSGLEVMYCGDHLYADVIKCRKMCQWRTLLVVPELEHEVNVTIEQRSLHNQLNKLESMLCNGQVDLAEIKSRLWECVKSLDQGFGHTGSLFRAGSRLTYFGSQMLAWADIYTGSVCNLAGYTMQHRFLPPPPTLPHEILPAQARGEPVSQLVSSRQLTPLPTNDDLSLVEHQQDPSRQPLFT